MRWFLDGASFQGRAENRAPILLWCHGIPGAGKTVLASTAFDELKNRHAERKVAMLIAFCLFDQGETQNAATIFSAYLKQVVELRGQISKQVQRLCSDHKGRPVLDLDTICDVLTAELQEFEKVYFILDGLDEISNRSERILLLEKLQDMVPCPKLLVTSRPLPDIRNWFYKDAGIGLYRIEHGSYSIELPGHLHEDCTGIANRSVTSAPLRTDTRASDDAWKLSSSYRCGNCNRLVCVYCYDAHETCLRCREPRSVYKWTLPSAVDVASHMDDIERAVDEYIKRSDELRRNVQRAKVAGLDLRNKIMGRVRANSQET